MADVLVDEVVVDGDRGGGAFAGGGDDLGAGVGGVAGGPDAGDAGAAGGVDARPSRCRRWRSRGRSAARRWGRSRGGRTPRSRGTTAPRRARRRSGGRPRRPGGRPVRRRRRWRGRRAARAGRRSSAAPLAKKTTSSDHCRMRWAWASDSGRAAEHAEGLVADLVAVAVGAVEQVAAPALADAGDVGDVVAEAGGDQDAPGAQDRPVVERDLEATAVLGLQASGAMAVTVPATSSTPYPATSARPAARSSAGGRPSEPRNPCMWAAGALRGWPASTTATRRRARAEDQGGGQAGGAAADDHDVVRRLMSCHERQRGLRSRIDNACCCFRESRGQWAVCTTPANAGMVSRRDGRTARRRPSRRPWTWSAPGCGGCASSAGLTLTEAAAAHGHLEEHAVAARERAAQARAWSCSCRSRRPTGSRSTTSSAHRRSATRASGSSRAGQRPHRAPADAARAASRRGRSSSRAPQSSPNAAHPRRVRVALRAVRADAARPRRPGPRPRRRVRRPSSTPRCRTGSAAPATEPAEVLSIFGRPGERMLVRAPDAEQRSVGRRGSARDRGRPCPTTWWRPSSHVAATAVRGRWRDHASTRCSGEAPTSRSPSSRRPPGSARPRCWAAWFAQARGRPHGVGVARRAGQRRRRLLDLRRWPRSTRAVPGTGAAALDQLQSGQLPVDARPDTLLNELSVLQSDLDLVLDDYHLADGRGHPAGHGVPRRAPPGAGARSSSASRADPRCPSPGSVPAGTSSRSGPPTCASPARRPAPTSTTSTPSASRRRRRRPRGSHRGLGGRPPAGGAVARRARRPGSLHRRLRGRRPLRGRLPRRRGARPAARRRTPLPARHRRSSSG